MIEELKNYYRLNGISAEDFQCPHYLECSRFNQDTFTTAKEAFVSSGYISHELPRILFLSLDSGSADNDPTKKTLSAVQQCEEIGNDVHKLPKNKHWYRTHELAYRLLRHFREGFSIGDAKNYFAHTNSAKCCMNNPGRAQANSILFENCRKFIPGEIIILSPDILITQGAHAEKAVCNAFPYLEIQSAFAKPYEIPEEMKLMKIGIKLVLWIHTFHPRNPGSRKNRDNYPIYERFAFEFMTHKPMDSNDFKEKEKVKDDRKIDGNYVILDSIPETSLQKMPKREECEGYEYMTMVQLCNIAESHGMTRSKACNAFGGDKGKYVVEPARRASAIRVGNQIRKYVFVSVAIDFFTQEGIKF